MPLVTWTRRGRRRFWPADFGGRPRSWSTRKRSGSASDATPGSRSRRRRARRSPTRRQATTCGSTATGRRLIGPSREPTSTRAAALIPTDGPRCHQGASGLGVHLGDPHGRENSRLLLVGADPGQRHLKRLTGTSSLAAGWPWPTHLATDQGQQTARHSAGEAYFVVGRVLHRRGRGRGGSRRGGGSSPGDRPDRTPSTVGPAERFRRYYDLDASTKSSIGTAVLGAPPARER